jgi:adenine-specific DNA-methyltransferase
MMNMVKKQNITEEIKIDENLAILKKHFPSCFDKDGRFNLEKFKEEIKIDEINLSKESYGLEWLGKSYARVLTFEPARTLLKEDEEWNKKDENINSENILIKGDNLEVLKHLVNAYYEKIKMIYIDPPYNTGNDGFVYQDDRKFSVKELMELAGVDEEKAKRILDFVNSKSNSHSAWLTFMYPRLYIARRLLKEDGVIFISIDDNEVAQLRLLMDEIFGEDNFVAQIVWENKEGGGGSDSKYFRIKHEL